MNIIYNLIDRIDQKYLFLPLKLIHELLNTDQNELTLSKCLNADSLNEFSLHKTIK